MAVNLNYDRDSLFTNITTFIKHAKIKDSNSLYSAENELSQFFSDKLIKYYEQGLSISEILSLYEKSTSYNEYIDKNFDSIFLSKILETDPNNFVYTESLFYRIINKIYDNFKEDIDITNEDLNLLIYNYFLNSKNLKDKYVNFNNDDTLEYYNLLHTIIEKKDENIVKTEKETLLDFIKKENLTNTESIESIICYTIDYLTFKEQTKSTGEKLLSEVLDIAIKNINVHNTYSADNKITFDNNLIYNIIFQKFEDKENTTSAATSQIEIIGGVPLSGIYYSANDLSKVYSTKEIRDSFFSSLKGKILLNKTENNEKEKISKEEKISLNKYYNRKLEEIKNDGISITDFFVSTAEKANTEKYISDIFEYYYNILKTGNKIQIATNISPKPITYTEDKTYAGLTENEWSSSDRAFAFFDFMLLSGNPSLAPINDDLGKNDTTKILSLTILYPEFNTDYRNILKSKLREFYVGSYIINNKVSSIGNNTTLNRNKIKETNIPSSIQTAILNEKDLYGCFIVPGTDRESTVNYYSHPYRARRAVENEIIGYYMGDSLINNGFGESNNQRSMIRLFLDIYAETRYYYYKVLMNHSFSGEKDLKIYEKIFITTISLIRFLDSKLDNLKNLSTFTKEDNKNFLESFGLSAVYKQLEDQPFLKAEEYMNSVIANYCDLMKKKGSKAVIENMMKIFNYEDSSIDIKRYYLLDETKIEEGYVSLKDLEDVGIIKKYTDDKENKSYFFKDIDGVLKNYIATNSSLFSSNNGTYKIIENSNIAAGPISAETYNENSTYIQVSTITENSQNASTLKFLETQYTSENLTRELNEKIKNEAKTYNSVIKNDNYWNLAATDVDVVESQLGVLETKYLSVNLNENVYKNYAKMKILISVLKYYIEKFNEHKDEKKITIFDNQYTIGEVVAAINLLFHALLLLNQKIDDDGKTAQSVPVGKYYGLNTSFINSIKKEEEDDFKSIYGKIPSLDSNNSIINLSKAQLESNNSLVNAEFSTMIKDIDAVLFGKRDNEYKNIKEEKFIDYIERIMNFPVKYLDGYRFKKLNEEEIAKTNSQLEENIYQRVDSYSESLFENLYMRYDDPMLENISEIGSLSSFVFDESIFNSSVIPNTSDTAENNYFGAFERAIPDTQTLMTILNANETAINAAYPNTYFKFKGNTAEEIYLNLYSNNSNDDSLNTSANNALFFFNTALSGNESDSNFNVFKSLLENKPYITKNVLEILVPTAMVELNERFNRHFAALVYGLNEKNYTLNQSLGEFLKNNLDNIKSTLPKLIYCNSYSDEDGTNNKIEEGNYSAFRGSTNDAIEAYLSRYLGSENYVKEYEYPELYVHMSLLNFLIQNDKLEIFYDNLEARKIPEDKTEFEEYPLVPLEATLSVLDEFYQFTGIFENSFGKNQTNSAGVILIEMLNVLTYLYNKEYNSDIKIKDFQDEIRKKLESNSESDKKIAIGLIFNEEVFNPLLVLMCTKLTEAKTDVVDLIAYPKDVETGVKMTQLLEDLNFAKQISYMLYTYPDVGKDVLSDLDLIKKMITTGLMKKIIKNIAGAEDSVDLSKIFAMNSSSVSELIEAITEKLITLITAFNNDCSDITNCDMKITLTEDKTNELDFLKLLITEFISYTTEVKDSNVLYNYNTLGESFTGTDTYSYKITQEKSDLFFYDEELKIEKVGDNG